MPVVFYDPADFEPDHGIPGARRVDTLDEVLAVADFVSLHMPGSAENIHLIDAAALAQMKPTAFLVNSARGDVIDQTALIEALRSETIAGAGLDVYEAEPDVPAELIELDNAVLLPHLGSATLETRTAMGMLVLENLQEFLAGREPPCRVA
jgi:lactate dehydrogenase-like 2-hydroxyacid dehydrogenase